MSQSEPIESKSKVVIVETPTFQKDADRLLSTAELDAMRIKLAGDPWIGTAESAGGTLAFPWGKGSRRLEVQYAVGVVEQNVTILLLALHDTEATSADKKVPSKTLRKAGEWGLVLAAKEAGKTLWEWLKDLF